MAARETVSQLPPSDNSSSSELIVPRHGAVTLFGYGIQVRVDRGHLILVDGIGPNRQYARLPRVGHGLKRLVVIGSDGMISLAALRWLSAQDVSFSMLERNGNVLAVTGPVSPSDSKLRRAQAVSHLSGAALRISRELISRKLAAQERVSRYKLLDSTTADRIVRFSAELPSADSITTIQLIESQAARVYWSAWSALPINFPKNDLKRVPEHWRTFGTRVSPLTGSPRKACNAANAILNFLYCLLEAEARLSASAMGLCPDLGVLHVDTPARDSLACDLMEPIRAEIDAYLLQWVTRRPLRREWFFEERDGNCRLMGSFALQLSETLPIWRRAVAPVAEWVARAFWATIRKPSKPVATRLTQNNKREAKCAPPQSPLTTVRCQQNICAGCGKPVADTSTHCGTCATELSRERMSEVARQGRIASKSLESRARVSATQRRQQAARWNWNPSSQPDWLTDEVYVKEIQPLLKNSSLSKIASSIGVSLMYASDLRRGRRRPHPRHWEALAKLAGVQGEGGA